MLRELSFHFRECNVLSGLASWAPLAAAAGTVMRSLSARCKAGQMAAPAGRLQQTVMRCAPAGSRGCVADRSPVAWQTQSAKVSWWRIMLYTLLLAVPGQVSPSWCFFFFFFFFFFLKCVRQITPSELLGLLEGPPFILVARRRPGLPLASPPSRWMWLVEQVLFAGPLNGPFWSARQRWRLWESAATWYKQPSCVTVQGAVMSYGGLNREKSSDAMWVSPHLCSTEQLV